MAVDSFKVKKSLNLEPGTATVDAAGDVRYNNSSNKLEYRDNSATRQVVSEDGTQTLTNKTLSGNTAATLVNGSGTFSVNSSGTITVPNATDTLVGRATTDTLTNKTLSGNTATNLINGSGTLNLPSSGTVTIPNGTGTLITNPMTTGGDVIYGGSSGTPTRLANGSSGQVLTSNGGTSAPSWQAAPVAPSGSVIMYGGSSAPTGWLLCDGSAVSRTTYADLFAVLSTTYGSGDGSTTFNLPDARGVFVRGAGTQTISSINYTGTRGTTQGDQMQGHRHNNFLFGSENSNPVPTTNSGANNNGSLVTGNGARITGNELEIRGPATDTVNGTPRTGSETRPANIVLSYIIKT